MGYLGPEGVAEYVWYEQYGGWDPIVMIAIAGAESGWNTDAISPTDDYGIFQINSQAWPQLFASGNWQDPATNTHWAHHVYSIQGVTAWSTYWGGQFQQYMPQATAAWTKVSGSGPPPTHQPAPPGLPPAVNAYDASPMMEQCSIHLMNAGNNLNFWARSIHELW